MSFLVIDDFCEDIERVIQSVHNAGFGTWRPNKGEVGSSIYDGMGFWGDHSLMIGSLIRNVGTAVAPNTMYFRVTNEGMERAYIHSDRESGNYTAICYLSEHEQVSGTAFFRHKKTGWTSMRSMAEMKELGVMEAMAEDMVSRDPDKWIQTDFVTGAYNRALIFNAPLFHSRFPLEGIGSTPDAGRLVWASHFHKVNSAGQLF